MFPHVRTLTFGAGVVSFIALGLGANANPLRMDPNSFLVRHVRNVQDLVNEVRSNPKVAQRYADQFALPKTELIEYFQKNLKVEKLAADRVHVVYYCNAEGRIFSGRLHLKKGTAVFVNTAGTPVLKMACGNPLRHRLPPPVSLTVPRITPPTSKPVLTAKLHPAPAPEQPEKIVEMVPPIETIPPEVPVTPVPPKPVPVVEQTSSITPAHHHGGGGGLFGLIIPIIGIGGGHGGCCCNTCPPPPPVPEPGSIFVIGTGLAFLGSRLRKR